MVEDTPDNDPILEYIAEFVEQIYESVPDDQKDTIEGIVIDKESLTNMLTACVEYVSLKLETQYNIMAEKNNSQIH
jgi:hypothetical protein